MEFEWDEKRLTFPDDRKDYGETRWSTIGAILGFIYFVVYTIRNTAIRIISARQANKREKDRCNNQ